MAINKSLHYNAKELLLYIAIVLAAQGALIIQSDVWVGTALLVIALVAVFARGVYKKFLDNGKTPEKEEKEEVSSPLPPPPEEGLQP